MNNIISLDAERKKRELLNLDSLELRVMELIKDLDLDTPPVPFFTSPLEMDLGYTYIQPVVESTDLDTVLANLMKSVLDLDSIGYGDLADRLNDIVMDAIGVHEST